jgi:spore maturation protein CgeB
VKNAILGLSLTSSWGNGHATTCRGLAARGHEVLFLERNRQWYGQNRHPRREGAHRLVTERRAMGARARQRVLAEHTAAHRAVELERYLAAL